MERVIDHNTQPGEPEELRLSLDELEEALSTPPKTVPRPLFFAVLALTIALAGLCAWLALHYVVLRDQKRIASQLAGDLDIAHQQLEQAQTDLAAARDELSQARDAIQALEKYSVAAPDGTAPEYTQLYPDLYAPAWEGETVAGGNVCCLTFDDGPSANTDRVLALLDQYGVKATFFVVGRTGAADQERLRKIAAAGHTIAMHSWSHDYKKVYASVESFLEEFNRLYLWIYEVAGVYPQVYRFPGGSINGYDRGVYQEIIAEMTRRGFVYFDWNASAQDATVHPRPAADIAADCLRGVGKDLAVVLCHDSALRGTTVEALPAVIQGYQAAGYTFSALHPGVAPVTFGYPVVK